ncbi:hypothetical protein [Kingella sp. (in: b-proteobacteria)]|uniref:hypothetical protein n=1 Tax=Kingella sp. (in: b-proteobacteria) TaxID=2020713 RepID=UPI0026DBDB76|nr:hypothetical protein [Kingella sp. (in: b-proteobacteria)]MDO4657486.1 hypothetical protein [Kingella sp. (in: b-proteobacteria)]
MTDLPKCRRAADAPSVTGFAKVSGCLNRLTRHKRQPENPSIQQKTIWRNSKRFCFQAALSWRQR